MDSTTNPLTASTEYNREQIQKEMDTKTPATPYERPDPRLTVAKAAFAFRDVVDTSRSKKPPAQVVSVQEVKETPKAPEAAPKAPVAIDPMLESERQHMRRHKRNIRIARLIQHLLTSIISLIIMILQVKIYSTHWATAGKNQTPQQTLNELLPVITLMVTAVLAIIFDLCAITAYVWPETKMGKKAFSFALQANYIITTFKSVAYAYSTVACSGSTVGGEVVVISMWLSIVNIAIEVFGLVIDQYVKRDAERFKALQGTDGASVETPAAAAAASAPAAASASDQQPLLPPTYSFSQHRYEKLGDSDFDQLDDLGDSLQSDLTKSQPKISAS